MSYKLQRFRWPLIGVLLLSVGYNPIVNAGVLIFEDGFEDTAVGQPPDPSYWGKCSGNCLTATTERARSGQRSMKVNLNRLSDKSSYRTEAVPRGPARNGIKEGDDVWYGFSIFIPADHAPDSLASETLAQWHHGGGSGGSPPLSLKLDDAQWNLRMRWSSGQVNKDNDKQGGKSWNLGAYEPGRWTDWVFRIKWSTNTDGVLQIWKNGAQVVNHQGPNDYANSGASWLKMGVYKTVWRNNPSDGRYDQNITERTFYLDEVRIARGADVNYQDVAPRGSHSNERNVELSSPGDLSLTAAK